MDTQYLQKPEMGNVMQRQELKNSFINTLEKERTIRGWTQWEMAEKLEMSVPGYRKMVSGMTDSIALYTAYRASIVLNIPIPILYGSTEYRDQVLNKIYNAPAATCNRIEYYLDFDAEFRHAQGKAADSGVWIDVITLSGYMEDGMCFDSANVEKVEIPDRYEGRVTKGIRVTENSLLPVYAKGDIILLEERMPRIGDITVSINMKTKIVYIRKVLMHEGRYELYPIHGRGKSIYIEKKDRSDWHELGRVISSIQDKNYYKE